MPTNKGSMTKSQSAAAATQQPENAQEEAQAVSINWIFFDKSKPDNCRPLLIKLDYSTFRATSYKCRSLFVTELSNELGYEALERDIMFWKPREPILVKAATKWMGKINDPNESLEAIELPASFAEELAGQIGKREMVHLVVTAKEVKPVADLYLSLNCLIRGDSPKRWFTVKVRKDDNISILRDGIKEKKAPHLNHIDASDLTLWKVSDLLLRDLGQKDVNTEDYPKLVPWERLSSIFEDLSKDCLHVIAVAPKAGGLNDPTEYLSLNCLIRGDGPNQMFTVKVRKDDNISILKDGIKENKAPHLNHIDASDLTLWKVSDLLLHDLGQQDVNTEDYPELVPWERLSSIFEDLSKDCLHVIAMAPKAAASANEEGETDTVSELKEFTCYRRTLSAKGLSPSEGAKSAGVSPPIEIFHPIFGRFIHIVNDPKVQPTPDDLKNVLDLMDYLSWIHSSDRKYAEELRQKLSHILGFDILPTENPDGTRPDGTITLHIDDARIVLLVLELRREIGDGGSDPSHQAGLSLKRSWIDNSSKPIREKCCCPTFLVAGAGSWMTVMGSVFTDRFIIQPLTDMKSMLLSSTAEGSRIYHNARIFVALQRCLHELKDFYKGLTNVPPLAINRPHPRYFPYPDSYPGENGATRFRYLRSLEEHNACVTYLAKLVAESKKVVVKFVARYGKEVHELLAEHNFAPQLLYCGPIPENPLSGILHGPAQRAPPMLRLCPDGMHMVVMEYVDGASDKLPDRAQIEEILRLLHSHGYVFGDLREPNILCDRNGKVKLIDFNWCGRYDVNVRDAKLPRGLQEEIDEEHKGSEARDVSYAYYPVSMSVLEGMWAPGMKPLAAIRPQHDWEMLDKFLPKGIN